jgi:hypothetical protein
LLLLREPDSDLLLLPEPELDLPLPDCDFCCVGAACRCDCCRGAALFSTREADWALAVFVRAGVDDAREGTAVLLLLLDRVVVAEILRATEALCWLLEVRAE